MSDTVKIVVELSKGQYEHLKDTRYGGIGAKMIFNKVLKGKPLSEELGEIREEIKALDEGITSYEHDDPWIYKREALEVIDKHIIEEGDKEKC